jgi:transcriptional repressor NrdR
MVCIYCGSATNVTNSRHQKRSNQVWRRRQCSKCLSIFTTIEVAQYSNAWRVRHGDKFNSFERDKLLLSLYKSCDHRSKAVEDASGICSSIVTKLESQSSNGIIEAASIAQTCLIALNRFDKTAAMRYQALHS